MAKDETSIEELLEELYLWLEDPIRTSSLLNPGSTAEWVDSVADICELRKKYMGNYRSISRLRKELKMLSTLNKYPDAETVIYDGMGWAHDGYYCRYSAGCPYVVADCEGNCACYGDMYHRCKSGEFDE